ncbi:MAG: nikB, partial [bacterium]|nr:nikB [bacterium]
MSAIARRLVVVPLTLAGITLVTFALLHALPGDAALVQAGTSRGASPESLAAMRHQYGLDRSLGAQYADWLVRSARLDFGDSLVDGRPVRGKIAAALPTTLLLALLAAALAFGVAVPLGAALGWLDRSRWARGASAALYVVYALPVAAVAM